MDPLRKREPLEEQIVSKLRPFMHERGWLTEKTVGSLYSSGWPDLYCWHRTWKQRWVEVKRPGGRLEPTQIKRFKRWERTGLGVWILTGIDDYQLLFKDPNWWHWLLKEGRR